MFISNILLTSVIPTDYVVCMPSRDKRTWIRIEMGELFDYWCLKYQILANFSAPSSGKFLSLKDWEEFGLHHIYIYPLSQTL